MSATRCRDNAVGFDRLVWTLLQGEPLAHNKHFITLLQHSDKLTAGQTISCVSLYKATTAEISSYSSRRLISPDLSAVEAISPLSRFCYLVHTGKGYLRALVRPQPQSQLAA